MLNHKTCDETGKVIFYSKADARKSLVGQLKSKRVRIYPCHYCHGMHVTKESITGSGRKR